MDTNWNIEGSLWTWQNNFSLWGRVAEDRAQVAQLGFRVSIFRDTPQPTGHSLEQLDLDGPDWAGVWTRWWLEVLFNLNHSVILWILKQHLQSMALCKYPWNPAHFIWMLKECGNVPSVSQNTVDKILPLTIAVHSERKLPFQLNLSLDLHWHKCNCEENKVLCST